MARHSQHHEAEADLVQPSVAERHEHDPLEIVEESRERLPWFLVSMAFHAALFFALSLVVFQSEQPTEIKEVTVVLEQIEEPIMKPPIKESVDTEHPIETETPIEQEPVIKEQMDERAETDDDAPTHDSSGDPDFSSDAPFDQRFNRSEVGLGGGGGGIFGNRGLGGADRGQFGQTGETEKRVERGLRWLANHQGADGSWDVDGYEVECARVGRRGDQSHVECRDAGNHDWGDPGLTGLALLAFLGAGNTHRTGEYRDVVEKALRYLKNIQSPDGCFGPKDGHYMYNHSIATLALTEAYAITGKPPLMKSSAQRAVDFLSVAQNPGLAWRYSVKCGDNDSSVTGWVVMALKSARTAELKVSRECFTGALTWIDKVTDERYYKVGYRGRGDAGSRLASVKDLFQTTEAMTAVGMVSRIFLGAKRNDPALRGGADLLVDDLPQWSDSKGTIDMYYWYYGSIAMFQMGGQHWKKWNDALKSALVDTQRVGDGTDGTWDPIGPWGGAGGRVYSTAINVLSLEIYYRYGRLLR